MEEGGSLGYWNMILGAIIVRAVNHVHNGRISESFLSFQVVVFVRIAGAICGYENF